MDDDDQLTAAEQAALDTQRGAPEPDAPPQPAPEAPQEGAGEPEAPEGAEQVPDTDKRPQMVPHAALHQERTRRQELERQSAEDRRKYEARFEELLKLVPQPAAAEPAAPPAVPDVQADPVGHIVGTLQQLGASQDQIRQVVAQQQAQQQHQQVVAALRGQAAAHQEVFRKEAPDFDVAIDYLRGIYDAQLIANGMRDPAQRYIAIENEANRISALAVQQGANIAERFYQIAKATGYKAAAEPAAQASAAGMAQPEAPAAPDQAARLRMMQQGQEQSRGLSNARGNGPAPMTAAKLLDMDDDAFLETMKKSKDARRLMGA